MDVSAAAAGAVKVTQILLASSTEIAFAVLCKPVRKQIEYERVQTRKSPAKCGEYREAIMIKMTMRLLAVALLFAVPQAVLAQTPPPSQPAAAPAQQMLTAGQLDALVAPIALYPDALLSEILMAATYPLEVVEADRWANANKSLQVDALKAALAKQNWDDSIIR
jgi:hypothetical protein